MDSPKPVPKNGNGSQLFSFLSMITSQKKHENSRQKNHGSGGGGQLIHNPHRTR